MRNRINEVQVGILTIAAIVVLIVGMMWFKNIDLSKGQTFYQADFTNVAGLREGDKVQVRGIRMGEVSGMHDSAGLGPGRDAAGRHLGSARGRGGDPGGEGHRG